jgi:hypothetical protein
MRITSGGNVGIGTASPSYKLDITALGYGIQHYGNSTNSLRTYAGSGYQVIEATTSTGVSQFGYVSNNFFVEAGGSERMRITSGGQLLVGDTSSPSTGFKIDSNGYINIRNGFGLVSRTSSTELWGLGDTDFNVIRAGVFGIATFTARDMMFATNNTERMRITSSGNDNGQLKQATSKWKCLG